MKKAASAASRASSVRNRTGARRPAIANAFVSYNTRDEAATEQIIRRLRRAGVAAWMFSLDLKVGDDWRLVTGAAKSRNDVWILFAGPHGIGSTQAAEVEEAVANLESKPGRFRVVPVLLPGIGPTERSQLPELFRKLYHVEFRTLADRIAFDRLLKAVHGAVAVAATAAPSTQVQDLAFSRRRLATLAARLVLRTSEALKLAKSPDTAGFHDALRAAGVTTAAGVLELETALAGSTPPFEPNKLWLAWTETVHAAKLDLIGKELLTMPAEPITAADAPSILPNHPRPRTAARKPQSSQVQKRKASRAPATPGKASPRPKPANTRPRLTRMKK
jgi:hypothetical protein